MDYTVSLTEAEDKAMSYCAADTQEWIDNAIMNRVRIATDDICRVYTDYKLNNNEAITATNKADMVIAAFAEGIVKPASEKQTPVGIAST